MQSRFIKLTLPINLYNKSKKIAKDHGYSNIQDLAIDSLRKNIEKISLQEAIKSVEKLKGSVKSPARRLTEEEKEYIAQTSLSRAKYYKEWFDKI